MNCFPLIRIIILVGVLLLVDAANACISLNHAACCCMIVFFCLDVPAFFLIHTGQGTVGVGVEGFIYVFIQQGGSCIG